MTELELALCASMLHILPELVQSRSRGLYELAQACAEYFQQPICEVMNPLSVALREMLRNGSLSYDRATHQIGLGAIATVG